MIMERRAKATVDEDGILTVTVGDDLNNFRVRVGPHATDSQRHAAVDMLVNKTGMPKLDIMLAIACADEGIQ